MTNKQELSIQIKKEEDINQWYLEVIKKADLIDYTDVSGCIVFKPTSYKIWEEITAFFNKKINSSGVRNLYFPLLIPESLFTKEKEHVAGFNPEVAWVTETGDKSLNERLAIRPTSETIICKSFAKWLKSYKDLPIRINQWCNVIRWEFKHPTPFLRTREFLWQEGHTLFETKKEADTEVLEILDYYKQIFEELLAIKVTKGRKSIKEKFAGADYTTTVEIFLPGGKSIQGATSHHLGQNFAKAFDIKYTNEEQQIKLPYQNSWGISTRSIGILILMHSDNRGLVLPPTIVYNKICIVPLYFKGKEELTETKAKELSEKLKKLNPILDLERKEATGFRFNKWELRGVPLRLEIGPKEITNNEVTICLRDTNQKKRIKINSDLEKTLEVELDLMYKRLYNKSKKFQEENTIIVENYEDFKKAIKEGKRCLVPWFEDKESEEIIKEETKAKTSCIPFEFNKEPPKNKKCFFSGKEATCWCYFSKTH